MCCNASFRHRSWFQSASFGSVKELDCRGKLLGDGRTEGSRSEQRDQIDGRLFLVEEINGKLLVLNFASLLNRKGESNSLGLNEDLSWERLQS